MTLRVAIVGAGFGGLAAACELASSGASVTVVERSAGVGGKASRFAANGFEWDTGPTLLTMPDVIESVVNLAGIDLRREVKLMALDPLCRYRFASGASFDHRVDTTATAEGIATIHRGDAARWGDFVRHAEEVYHRLGVPYLSEPFEGTWGFARRFLQHGGGRVSFTSLQTLSGHAERWFASNEMRQFVQRFATYVGADPSRASAAFTLIAHVEGRGHAVYPRGGIHAVAQVVARAARRLGVSLLLNEACESIERSASGPTWRMRTASRVLEADVVILNVDPVFAGRRFFAAGSAEAESLTGQAGAPRSMSGALVLLGLRGTTAGLATHNVFFPKDYAAEFKSVMRDNTPDPDATVYICAPSAIDPSAAPPGHEALFAMVNAPPAPDLEWNEIAPRLETSVLDALQTVDASVRRRVVTSHFLGPREIAATGSIDGAIYGGAPHGVMGPFRRPAFRVRGSKGLYLVGGATHPGGGVPMTTLSGRHVASLIRRDFSNDLSPASEAS